MVVRYLFLLICVPFFLLSGEFTASVNRNQVTMGEGFTLTLSLKNASAKTSPSLDHLTRSFSIHSQQQMSNTSILNGKITSTISWKIVLLPLKEGEVIIPSIPISSSEGTLSTDPIAIRVTKNTAAKFSEANRDEGVHLNATVSKASPFKNEPVYFTIKLTSRQTLVNIQAQKLEVENAIVQLEGEPKISEKIGNGLREGVIEFNYLITPLQAGPIKIPSLVVQGASPFLRRTVGRSFMDDDFDPLSLMLGYDQLKPFALTTEEIVLDVQPPVSDVNPWLPAQSLRVEEVWDESQSLQEGEFFTRELKITAEGISSSQLPGLNDLQLGGTQFKVYADKPELKEEIRGGLVRSSRSEKFTLIPQQSGTLVLPEIAISWWNVEKNEKAVAVVPARTLDVKPGMNFTSKTKAIVPTNETTVDQVMDSIIVNQQPLLYTVIAVLSGLLLVAIIIIIVLLRKVSKLVPQPIKIAKPVAEKSKEKVPAKSNKETLNDLNPT